MMQAASVQVLNSCAALLLCLQLTCTLNKRRLCSSLYNEAVTLSKNNRQCTGLCCTRLSLPQFEQAHLLLSRQVLPVASHVVATHHHSIQMALKHR
jgi:hypothetical protein